MAAATISLAVMLALPLHAQAPTRAAAAVPVHVVPPVQVELSETLWALLDAHAEEHPYKDGAVVGRIERRVPQTVPEIICAVDWPCGQAQRVAFCESTNNPRAINSSGHRGLFQISTLHSHYVGGNLEALFDPQTNVRVAHAIYVSSGRTWRAWSCRP